MDHLKLIPKVSRFTEVLLYFVLAFFIGSAMQGGRGDLWGDSVYDASVKTGRTSGETITVSVRCVRSRRHNIGRGGIIIGTI